MPADLRGNGASEAQLLTTTAAPFFERPSFRSIEREEAPAVILNTRQASTTCSGATLLVRRLDD